jgi:hypothetical protein
MIAADMAIRPAMNGSDMDIYADDLDKIMHPQSSTPRPLQ